MAATKPHLARMGRDAFADLYYHPRLSIARIAKTLGCSKATVHNLRAAFNLTPRYAERRLTDHQFTCMWLLGVDVERMRELDGVADQNSIRDRRRALGLPIRKGGAPRRQGGLTDHQFTCMWLLGVDAVRIAELDAFSIENKKTARKVAAKRSRELGLPPRNPGGLAAVRALTDHQFTCMWLLGVRIDRIAELDTPGNPSVKRVTSRRISLGLPPRKIKPPRQITISRKENQNDHEKP